MKKSNLLFSSLLLTVILVFSYCSKDPEAGPQGPAGPAGPAGPVGPQGPKGDTGVANVIYSNWLDVSYQEDTDNPGTWLAQINAPKLTNDIINKGEIKVYWNLGSAADPLVVPIPYFDGGTIINPLYDVGAIYLLTNAGDVGTATSGGVKFQQYRYILIPGVVPGRMATVNWNNYEEVKKYLGLKD